MKFIRVQNFWYKHRGAFCIITELYYHRERCQRGTETRTSSFITAERSDRETERQRVTNLILYYYRETERERETNLILYYYRETERQRDRETRTS